MGFPMWLHPYDPCNQRIWASMGQWLVFGFLNPTQSWQRSGGHQKAGLGRREAAELYSQQGWKTYHDEGFSQRRHITAPWALELHFSVVQGYVYQAKMHIAEVYEALGENSKANQLRVEAQELQVRFHEAFWMEDRQYYAMAMDANGRRLDVLSSDAGQCL